MGTGWGRPAVLRKENCYCFCQCKVRVHDPRASAIGLLFSIKVGKNYFMKP